MRYIIFTFLLFLLSLQVVTGQVSQGGQPMGVPVLKSRGLPVVVMPAVDNETLLKEASFREEEIKLKPFRFAHGFDVDISPETNGVWTYNINGRDVWQVKIISRGAYSLNLVFDSFKLTEGARLFLFNEAEGHYLGAYTSFNNKPSGKFAVSPVAGDELTVQYEVPAGKNGTNDFVISQVNHDFFGILKYSDRRPTGMVAASCNIDINCPEGDEWSEIKDAVCRIIVNGKEVCSGALINNTAEDRRPYIISAAHCYDKQIYAETSVYTFNYESPYCAPLDGDPSNSVSGAVMKAFSDSLDFSLVELSIEPPPSYRPYFVGWNKNSVLPESSVSIHHPWGDIKKIAYDNDAPVYSDFLSSYTPKGFIKVLKWDGGVTESGSSGGPLFNPQKQLVGTLTGGNATCISPVNDYFSRFDMAWEFRNDSSKQLKYWLDPLNQNISILEGKRFYAGEELCGAYTNLESFDEHGNIVLEQNGSFAGYRGGTNSAGITGFAERFVIPGNINIFGVSIGVGKLYRSNKGAESEIRINVYNGSDSPEELLHTQKVKLKNLAADAMNFIQFTKDIYPADTFFVGYELSNLQAQDTLVVFQSLRENDEDNHFWYMQNDVWFDFKKENSGQKAITNVFELLVCNTEGLESDTPIVRYPVETIIYPNPTSGYFTFEYVKDILPENINVYNLIGQAVRARIQPVGPGKVRVDMSGNLAGVYFVRLKTETEILKMKLTYLPR